MDWLKGLNAEQCEAVLHNHGPLLILAGAGSGKTTVLVARTGRLIHEGLAKANEICVLTFTNKAATELKHRVAAKVGKTAKNVWAGTFHGFGLQFLKKHWEKAGLPKRFGVMDRTDSLAIIKDLLREHRHSEKEGFKIEVLFEKILLLRQGEKLEGDQPEDEMAIMLHPKYQSRKKNLGVVDFEDLLIRPLEMMKADQLLRDEISSHFKFIMVDEFQDTNLVQMELIDELSSVHRNVAVVGDDDQSIYGWRGAKIQNILGFPNRYPKCQVVRLEQNYRSSSQILDLANNIIDSNKTRHKKVLKSAHKRQGDPPELFVLEDEEEEIDFVVREIESMKRDGHTYGDIAILYRSNSQGGMIEGGLRRSQIPYQITGGTALFDKKEAKDMMGFLRAAFSPTEVAMRRVINLPPRGIGDAVIEKIDQHSFMGTFDERVQNWLETNAGEKAADSLREFFEFLDGFRAEIIDGADPVERIFDRRMRELGYRSYVENSYKDIAAADSRWLCVTIVGRILDGMFTRHGRTGKTVQKFIDAMELRDVDGDKDGDKKDEVQLMTLHACKGLEFPIVFLLGLEEDLLPHARLGQDVNEERRLFYVGVTRAQRKLIMTRARQRKKYGRNQPVAPSRFLVELNTHLYKELQDGRPVTGAARESLVAAFLNRD